MTEQLKLGDTTQESTGPQPATATVTKGAVLADSPDIVEAVNKADEKPPIKLGDIWTANNGVRFKTKKVRRLVVVEAGKAIPMPQQPQVWIEDKQRYEPNPNDPDYIEAVMDANYKRGMVTVNVSLGLGSSIERPLPEGIVPPESEEWTADLASFGVNIPEKGMARYVAWLKYYALNDEEITELTKIIMAGEGIVFQEEVVEATKRFPDTSPRDTN